MNLSNTVERNSRLGLAHAKNKSEQSKMSVELEKIEKEKQTELRLLRNVRKKFKCRYSRTNISEFANSHPHKTIESRGLLTERDRDHPAGDRPSSSAMPEENFKMIHKLIFSNGEIDIDKVLCLHLLSAHRAETLTPPKKKLVYVCKMHSPVERLLERSKRKHLIQYDHRFVNILPLYSIELLEFGAERERTCPLINDGRLAARILLNIQFRELINSVLSALNQSNPEKKREIIDAVNDIDRLRSIFRTQKILNFVADLSNYPSLKNCESYVFTAPFRIRTIQLEIRTKDGDLEDLIKQIRKNVLQIPPRIPIKLDVEETKQIARDRPKIYPNIIVLRKRMNKSDSISEIGLRTPSRRNTNSDSSRRSSADSDRKIGRHENKNFIQRNIEAAAKAKRIEYDTDEEDNYNPRRLSKEWKMKGKGMDSSEFGGINLKQPLTQVVEENVFEEDEAKTKVENEEIRSNLNVSSKEDQEVQTFRSKRKSSNSVNSQNNRLYIKHNICPACTLKWKQPLPPPKTPRIDKNKVIPLLPGENPFLKTNSQNRISSLIHKELFKLETYDRRYSSGSQSSRRSSMRRQVLEDNESDYWNLSPMDRAKIEQEVREKETQLKLQKFLKE